MALQLYPHQERARDFGRSRKWVLLGDEMGLGKSLEALTIVLPHSGNKLIVVPAYLKLTWKKEIEKWFPETEIGIVTHGKSKYTLGKDAVYVTSYELLKHCEIFPTSVIFDECHYLKNLKAKRTQIAHDFVLVNRPEYCIGLSGTPIKNDPTEFYSILKLLSYCPSNTNGIKVLEKSQYAFNIRFSHPVSRTIHTPNGAMQITEFRGIRNLDRLKAYLKGKYLRRLTNAVIDLPPLIEKEVFISQRKTKQHLKLVEAFMAHEDGEKSEHIMSVKIDNAVEKTGFTLAYVLDMLEQGEPVIVFTDHLEPCRILYEALKSKQIKVGAISGKVNPTKRIEMVDAFQDGKLDVLVCTIPAASVGLTITRAKNMVFNDIPWGWVDLQQAIKRIHRIGQDARCVIHFIFGSDIDKWLLGKVRDKEALLKQVL